MSNRLRFLFHTDLDGVTAHVGRHALRRMQQLCTEMPEEPKEATWVIREQWYALGKPQFKEKKLGWTGKNPEMLYLVPPKPKQVPPQELAQAELVPSVATAKLLWETLPVPIRDVSSLLIIREGRRNQWRGSRSNPRTYGWQPWRAPKPQADAPEVQAKNPWLKHQPIHFQYAFDDEGPGQIPGQIKVPKAPKKKAKPPVAGAGLAAAWGVDDPAVEAPHNKPKAPKAKLRLGIWS